MKKHNKLQGLYDRSGKSTDQFKEADLLNGANGHSVNGDVNGDVNGHHPNFPRPSIFQKAQLWGIPYKPRDIYCLSQMVIVALWSLFRLHFIELPYQLLTGFKNSSQQHLNSWTWPMSIVFSIARGATKYIRTLGQIRFIGFGLNTILPLQLHTTSNIKRNTNVKFKVKLDVLTRPERATLFDLREHLRANNFSDDLLNPSKEYLESMHPKEPNAVANLPEEVGTLDSDGTYTLTGEWIEALDETPKRNDSNSMKPRSKTVMLYFHGGAHVFCSPASHAHMMSQIAKSVGPGTRVFTIDYRLAPENPFPAAIHDAYAAYLYLTEPTHAALVLDEESAVEELAVDPRDIVIGGDSAGANIALAFMMYMTKYVQPSTEPKFILPHAMMLLSPWVDSTSVLPAVQTDHTYCFVPSHLGSSPFDKETYFKSNRPNFTNMYVCGDHVAAPNARNAMGDQHRWEWYRHLAQHPLVCPVFTNDCNLKGLTNTLVQVGALERMVDEGRLIAHRIGLQNPNQLTRIENYRDMVHVHQVFTLFLHSSRVAVQNIARFIERSEYLRDEMEREMQLHPQDFDAVNHRLTYAAMLRKTPARKDSKLGEEMDHFDEYMPAYMLPSMIQGKATIDGVERVFVAQDGHEYAGDEGLPFHELLQLWPAYSHSHTSKEE